MMNRIIGLLALYSEGLPPSRMPPCGATLAVLDAEAEATVLVTTSVIVVVTVAMVGVDRLLRRRTPPADVDLATRSQQDAHSRGNGGGQLSAWRKDHRSYRRRFN